MTTIATNQWEINGVIDTSQSVISNLNAIANASGCYLTWDSGEGTWSVVINDTGSSVYSFNDSNIIGNINVSGSGISEMYNAVTIEFPHKDLRDTTDYIDLKIPTADRFAQELDNVLTITTELVNDPIQAALIASRELKQSRLDKTIEFRTDYIANGLKAGDLIDVTNTVYGYTNKVFRVIQIEEEDAQDGSIIYSIVALEYDADVYSTDDLERTYRSKKTGIVPKAQNTAITASNNNATTSSLADSLLDPTNAGIISLLMSALAGSNSSGNPRLTPTVDTFRVNSLILIPDSNTQIASLGRSIIVPYSGYYKVNYNINWGSNVNPSPPMGVFKNSTIRIIINGSSVSLGDWASTGDSNVQIYEDHNITGLFYANAGQQLDYYFDYATNLNPGDNIAPAGYPSYVVPADALAAVWIIVELQFIGA